MPMKNSFKIIFLILMTLSLKGCLFKNKKNTNSLPASTPESVETSLPPPLFSSNNCIKIYYDRSPFTYYKDGYAQSLLLRNLLGHFINRVITIEPIELYKQGDLFACNNNFYLGSYYNNLLPHSFLMDSTHPSTSLVWMGYNHWQLGSFFQDFFGYQFNGLTKINSMVRSEFGAPTYFSQIYYKDIILNKIIQKHPPFNTFIPYEISVLTPAVPNPPSHVLSIIKNPWTNETLPYLIQRNKKFYFTEIPLAYMPDSQQYLVLADLLFDILEVPRLRTPPQVGLSISTSDLESLNPLTMSFIMTLQKNNIPYFISFNPQSIKSRSAPINSTALNSSQGLIWDISSSRTEKSILEVISNLKQQQNQLIKFGLKPLSIIDPGPSNSALENLVYLQLFPFKIGQAEVYSYSEISTISKTPLTSYRLEFPITDLQFNSLTLKYPKLVDSFHQSQFIPYRVFNDVMGRSLIPLLTTIGSESKLESISFQIISLARISNSTHFINIDSSTLQREKDYDSMIRIIDLYRKLNYQFINKSYFSF